MNLSFENSEEGYSMKKYISAFLSLIMTISGAVFCYAEESAAAVMSNVTSVPQPLGWGQSAPKAVENSTAENKFILTDGEKNTKELTLLNGAGDKAFIAAPSTGALAFYADSSAQFQIIDVNDPKSLFYKINQDDYITQNVLPVSMQEYLLTTGWKTEAGYSGLDAAHSNMQSETVTYSKAAILSQREYYDNADKIGYKDATGLTLRSPVTSNSKKMLQMITAKGELDYVDTYSAYYSTFPCFYVSSGIFKKYKLVSAGTNVIKYIGDTFSVPELLEIYTKDELEGLGFAADYPTIENVSVTGNSTVGSTLAPVYDYSNTGNVPEGESVYEWYRVDANGNAAKTNITSRNYTVSTGDIGYRIYCSVTPYDANGSRGIKCDSALSDEISADGFSAAFDGLVLNADGKAEITFNFGNMNTDGAIAILEVYDGYKLTDSKIQDVNRDGELSLSAVATAENAYAKAFVIDKSTNKVCVALTKNIGKKPSAAIDGGDYSIRYDSDNEVYVLSGTNSSVTASAVYIGIKPANAGEPVFRTCEFVKDGKLLMYFNMPESEQSGDYAIEICADKLKKPIGIGFYYSSIRNKSSILEMLNNAESADKYAEILSQKMRELEINDKYAAAMDKGGFEFLGRSLCGKQYSVDEIKDFYNDIAVYSAYYNLSNLKSGKEALECAEYYADKIKLSENELYSDFAALSDGDKEKVFSLFGGRTINNPAELDSVFKDSVVLTRINSAESYGMLNNYLLKYEAYLSFGLSDYKACDTTAASMYLFKTYSGFGSMDELKAAVAKAVAEADTGGGQSGGQSGGSGRGSGGGSGTVKRIEVDNDQVKEPVNPVSMFGDVSKSHWAYEYILKLKKNKVISGNEDNLFEPEKNITREEFVKMTAIAIGIVDEEAKCDFDDVGADDWCYKYVASAKSRGIIDGVETGRFGVGELITREDMAVIISRACNLASEDSAPFSDENLISDYAKSSVAALSAAKIINGFEDGTFRPKAFAARAEAVKIICGLIK